MKHLPKAVLFDFNGTINDMSVIMAQDVHVGKVEFGLELSEDDIRECWGTTPDVFYPMLFGRGGSQMRWTDMRHVFRKYDSQFPRRVLPGVEISVDALERAGIAKGIVTATPATMVHSQLEQSGFDPARFELIHTGDQARHDNPSTVTLLRQAIGTLALNPQDVIFVGDELTTIFDAQATGTDYLIIANGTASRDDLLSAGVPTNYLLGSMLELPQHLGI